MRDRLVKELLYWVVMQLGAIHIEVESIVVTTDQGIYMLVEGEYATEDGK